MLRTRRYNGNDFCSHTSSGGTDSSVPLYCASLALHWLSALYIALRWLPIALVWLPTTRFFITRAPNIVTRLVVELHPLHRLPALAPSPTYRPVLAPYTGSHNSGLHLKNYRLEVDLQPQTSYSPTHLKDSKLEVELQPS